MEGRAISREFWSVDFQFFFFQCNFGLVRVEFHVLWVANLRGDTVQLLLRQVQPRNFLVRIRRVSLFLGLIHLLIFLPQAALIQTFAFWCHPGFILPRRGLRDVRVRVSCLIVLIFNVQPRRRPFCIRIAPGVGLGFASEASLARGQTFPIPFTGILMLFHFIRIKNFLVDWFIILPRSYIAHFYSGLTIFRLVFKIRALHNFFTIIFIGPDGARPFQIRSKAFILSSPIAR